MNEDVVASSEGKAAGISGSETADEQRERSVVLLLEALEGRLSTPDVQELLRVLAPDAAGPGERRTGRN